MNLNNLRERAGALRLHGVLAHWGEADSSQWLATLVQWEEDERARRSLPLGDYWILDSECCPIATIFATVAL